ncbi:MAG TPA: hypothetical protein VGJ05_21540, partial [Fimbriiglobus sp.]
AVATAVRDVVAAGLRGDSRVRSEPPRPADRWSDDPWADESDPYRPTATYGVDSCNARLPTAIPTAVAAAAAVARWWFRRRGTLVGALAVGLTAVALGAAGGPIVRLGLAVVAGSADLLIVPDLLGRAAGRFADV